MSDRQPKSIPERVSLKIPNNYQKCFTEAEITRKLFQMNQIKFFGNETFHPN